MSEGDVLHLLRIVVLLSRNLQESFVQDEERHLFADSIRSDEDRADSHHAFLHPGIFRKMM